MSGSSGRSGRRKLIKQGMAAAAAIGAGTLAVAPAPAAAQPQPAGAGIVAVVTGLVFGGAPDQPDKPAISVTYIGASDETLGDVEVAVNPADPPQKIQQQIVDSVRAQWNELFQAQFGPAGRVLVFGAPFQG